MYKYLISLLPLVSTPTMLFYSDKLPCLSIKIERTPIKFILDKLKRKCWTEGLYAKKKDLAQIKRYKNSKSQYKNDFDERQYLTWVKAIEENTAICEMENKNVGKGVFVLPEKTLPKGTFIPSTGIIKLDPTVEELETKNHCSALQDLNTIDRKIYGLIDPEKQGGILDLINHAPDDEELNNFNFRNAAIKENVATSNLKGAIKFYNGYAIVGIEAFQDIEGGKHGKQLLWSYAQPDEYLPRRESKLKSSILLLFDKRGERNGKIIDVNNYSLKIIDIYFDIGELTLLKIASLTRWELMNSAPESEFNFSIEDPYSSAQSEIVRSPVTYVFLQSYLKQNPHADRIIIKVPASD